MYRKSLTVIATLIVSMGAIAQPADPSPHQIPQWFLEHIERMTRGSGIWVADNRDYQSQQEPHDAYATHWQKGLGGKSLRGRLYGLTDGQESGTFWEFRSFWHPQQQRVIIQQFGATGVFGTGTLINLDGNRARGEQTFYATDGGSFEGGHSFIDHPGRQDTTSFDIRSDGSWRQRRHYEWVLQQ